MMLAENDCMVKKMVKTSSLMDDRIIKYEDVDIDARGRLDPAGSLVFGQ